MFTTIQVKNQIPIDSCKAESVGKINHLMPSSYLVILCKPGLGNPTLLFGLLSWSFLIFLLYLFWTAPR